jgi:ankyrin repeat protein
MLLEEGADVNQTNGYVVEGLAEEGDVSHACCCRHGWAPIHYAADGGHLSILEYLVAQGADVHAQDR